MKRIVWGLLILLTLIVSGCGAGGKINGADTGGGDGTGGTNTGAVPTGVFNYTVPNEADTGIVTNSNIYIIFNQKMNEYTVTPSYFSVICDGINQNNLSVTYDDSNMMATLKPSGNLTGAATCTVTAKKGLRIAGSNQTIGKDYIFKFSTASDGGVIVPINTPLGVDFTVPIDNATGVIVTEPFYMIFNKALNPLTVTETSFSAACGSAASQTPIAGFTADYVTANNAVVVKPPSAGWPGGQVCKIVARKDYVKDSANVALESDQVFTFSTGAAGDDGTTALAVDYAIPVTPADQIAVNSVLTFVFNKALNEVTAKEPTSFIAVCGGQAVNGYTVNYNSANNSIKLTPPGAGWGNGALCDITIRKVALWAADNVNMADDYTYTFSTITTSGIAVDRLSLRADKYTVKSTGTDQAIVTVKALDSNGATIPSITISLSTDQGELSKSTVTTGGDGTATFTFNADTTRANGVATITASSGLVTPVSLPMTIAGTTLLMTADKSVTKSGPSDGITLTVTLKDADNNPMTSSNVTISSALGNTLTSGATSGSSITAKTDNSGNITLSYSAANIGDDIITATGFGASAIANVTVTNATFAFTSPDPNTIVNSGDDEVLTLQWLNDAGTPEVGKSVTFSATNGNFAGFKSRTEITNGSGVATLTYTASPIASPDVITATAGALQTNLPLNIQADNPTQLYVQATSTVIGIKTPGNTPTTTIIATVRDPNDNPVAGQIVNFSLDKGAGGGEYLSPPSAVTDSAGQARTTFYAGTAASQQNGVTISASIDNIPALTDTVDLTISGAAASIVFGTSNEIGEITIDGYTMAYEMPVTILVTDINGGPIANQAVSIGIYPKKFKTGIAYKPETSTDWVWAMSAIFDNEDANKNAILDAGEDGARGLCIDAVAPWGLGTCTNGDTLYYHSGGEALNAVMLPAKDSLLLNGRLDPRNVATVPMEVLTDANGLALIKIIYPKSYCNWIETELSATTQVSGTETRAVYNTNLTCMDRDDPYASSPFGY